ncbi:quinone-dependent dihydroorotate dehydrogenase [Agitococcus lubricus]|uniref:Dihydroorotate dehydrogenase (quinone) n=1 Tax=Agitococcus lubricus TaxID=1077255 RepID=A0A2T5IX12_9GAMM|nr:quinone-dependent dihydroorotate dehydrogenase [Agitococcus lubricus]PTQ88453.1 dihydroorotate oxidase A [Agitococcus lubricus]
MFYPLIRQLLFRLSPEASHHAALRSLAISQKLGLSSLVYRTPQAPVRVMGIDFPNPVGLAAGLDKNGDYIDALAALGFGFIEIGTITPRPQAGNPQPRLFRLPEAQAIINRMGFNNLGVEHLVNQVKKAKFEGVLGINIGKNFDTPVENAADDYIYCLERVYEYADYVTVNISSPNTQGLRSLQTGSAFSDLLQQLKNTQQRLAEQHGFYVPLAVKIAPDLQDEDIEYIAEQLVDYEIDAVIATNTTIGRSGIESLSLANEAGGLSGKPLKSLANYTLARLCQALDGRIPVIGVGGIMDGASAADKILAGASLVQVYTGFIYAGPQLIADSVQAIQAVQA